MSDLNIQSLVNLGGEIFFVAVAALLLFYLRRRISLAPLFIFVGSNQFLGQVLASSLYLVVGEGTVVSPGSMVLFSSYLFVILLVYLRADIPTTRGLIIGIVVANVTLAVLLWLTAFQITTLNKQMMLDIPVELFAVSPGFFLFGTLMLLIDSLLVVMLYEFFTQRGVGLPRSVRIVASLALVLCLDAVLFSFALASGETYFADVLRGQLLGKLFAGILFGLILSLYLWLCEPVRRVPHAQAGKQILSIFTHREKYHEVREKLKVSEAANVAKNRFLAHVSHELRTPLNAIIGFTQVLVERSTTRDENRLLLTRVLENGKHLLTLINELLDLSKIDSGQVELEVAPVELGALLRDTVQQLEGEAMNKPVTLSLDTPPGDLWLETDRVRLRQVLINLLGNALKFTDKGTVTARLVLGAKPGGGCRIDVQDSGPGILPDDQESIFEPFYQVEKAESNRSGTGLGLAISQALCKQLGFGLTLESEPGSGSIFSIHIPLEAVSP